MSAILISKAEKSFIQAGLITSPSTRADGRSLQDYRRISIETSIAPLANGSARVSIGRNPYDGSGGTEVLAATKLEVEMIGQGNAGVEGGRIACSVSCYPAAYPHLSAAALEDLQYDMTTIVEDTLTHPSLHPNNLGILSGKKSWLLNVDVVVLVDSGNVYDAIFMAARAALWDTKVPRTRSVEYKAKKTSASTATTGGTGGSKTGGSGDMDVDEDVVSGFDTRNIQNATDFELPDYWDEGEVLDGRQYWPICVTLNLVSPVHFLDATLQEEAATPLRVLLMHSFDASQSSTMHGIRTLGSGELTSTQMADLIKDGEKYAQEIWQSLNTKLKEENIGIIREKNKF